MTDPKQLDSAFQQLANTLAGFLSQNLPQDEVNSEIEKIKPYCKLLRFADSEHLCVAGDQVDNIFFVVSGLVRFYYLTDDGKFHNKSFSMENQFAGAMQPPNNKEKVRFNIQALEPCLTLAIPVKQLYALYTQSLLWANIGRVQGETLALRKQRREEQFLLDSAETRYQSFIQQYPTLVNRLPLYHIASYLGITDVALSRIRRRLNPG